MGAYIRENKFILLVSRKEIQKTLRYIRVSPPNLRPLNPGRYRLRTDEIRNTRFHACSFFVFSMFVCFVCVFIVFSCVGVSRDEVSYRSNVLFLLFFSVTTNNSSQNMSHRYNWKYYRQLNFSKNCAIFCSDESFCSKS